jgi:hypothetical protein
MYQLSTCVYITMGIENGTILKHFCLAWGEAEGCTVLLKGDTISMPMGRHVDNDFISSLKIKTDF